MHESLHPLEFQLAFSMAMIYFYAKTCFLAAQMGAMDKWLQDYPYRININWWVYVFAGLLAILIGLIATGFQAIKAAIANPVKCLRSE